MARNSAKQSPTRALHSITVHPRFQDLLTTVDNSSYIVVLLTNAVEAVSEFMSQDYSNSTKVNGSVDMGVLCVSVYNDLVAITQSWALIQNHLSYTNLLKFYDPQLSAFETETPK